MQFLPVHKMKLRWLLSKQTLLKKADADYLTFLDERLSVKKYKSAHPISVYVIEQLYESYKLFFGGKKHENASR